MKTRELKQESLCGLMEALDTFLRFNMIQQDETRGVCYVCYVHV